MPRLQRVKQRLRSQFVRRMLLPEAVTREELGRGELAAMPLMMVCQSALCLAKSHGPIVSEAYITGKETDISAREDVPGAKQV